MHPFDSQFAAAWPPEGWAEVTVILAVSGGADSVALLRAARRLKEENGGPGGLAVGHFNHGLRGDEAERDERFVVETCDRLGVACHVGRAQPGQIAGQGGDGLEQAARMARYRFLRTLAGELGARFVATAHTADDQAETILHRILRGTGVRGLAGIPRVRRLGHATLIRPMLFARRSDVVDYLAALDQPFCHDSSNADRALTRNRIRHELLPALATGFNPAVVEALLRLGGQARELQAVVDHFAGGLYDRCVVSLPQGRVRIERGPLLGQPPLLVREVLIAVWRRHDWPLQAMGYAEWDELAAMATSQEARRRHFPGNVSAEVAADGLELMPERAAGEDNRWERR